MNQHRTTLFAATVLTLTGLLTTPATALEPTHHTIHATITQPAENTTQEPQQVEEETPTEQATTTERPTIAENGRAIVNTAAALTGLLILLMATKRILFGGRR